MDQASFTTNYVNGVMSKISELFQQETALTTPELPNDDCNRTTVHHSSNPSSYFTESSTPQHSPRPVSSQKFLKTTYMRMQNQETRKQQRLQKLSEKFNREQEKNTTYQPNINKKYKLKTQHAPLYSRADIILQQKREKLEIQREAANKKREEAENRELVFKPKINKYKGKVPDQGIQFTERSYQWKQKQDDMKTQKQNIKSARELQGATFEPSLCKKSMKLVKKKGDPQKAIEERLLEIQKLVDQKKAAKAKELLGNFTPKISNRSKHISSKKNKKEVFARLYEASIGSMSLSHITSLQEKEKVEERSESTQPPTFAAETNRDQAFDDILSLCFSQS